MSSDLPHILVVGGAGYIGAHMVLALRQAGYIPIVLDNLSTGYQRNVLGEKLIIGDMRDQKLLNKLFLNYQFFAVMHFASLIDVAESVKFPGKYYQNNVAATLNLLDSMQKHKVNYLIFSSSAAVYGQPQYLPIDELHPLAPISPYGRSKWMVEEIIKDYATASNLHYIILRYFNASGAHPNGCLGENHDPESHLIPLILNIAIKETGSINVYGKDYPTIDGTCVRDYVHVLDLCNAHLLSLQALRDKRVNKIYNLGAGLGYSVQQVIDIASQITGKAIPQNEVTRRAGDAAILIANTSLAKGELCWQPNYVGLDIIIQHAWAFIRQKIGGIST